MPSGNTVMPENMQFPSGAGTAGGEIHYCQQWIADERDGFISWLRSEFAAANAIIDSLCHHLRVVGEPREYEMVVGAIQQRRCNWNQVLLMQQYFSVSEVVYALQQVQWRRQQRYVDPVKAGPKEFRKSGQGFRQGQRFEAAKEGFSKSSVESYGHQTNSLVTGGTEKGTYVTEKNEEPKAGGKVGTMEDKSTDFAEEKKDSVIKHHSNGILKGSGNSQESLSNSESEVVGVNDGYISNSRVTGYTNQNQSQNASTMGRTFIGNEMFDGKMVNSVDGLKLYEDLFDSTEVSELVSFVNDLRVTGKRGQFQGSQTYLVSRRPMKGRGREIIQFGVSIVDAPADVENVEPIPSLFQDIIEHMVASQVMTVKPDACIVDFYNEGDYSQPYSLPPWFGRPVCMLFLTECDMTFGRVIVSDHPGDYRGTLNLSLVPGSFMVMQGKSTDFAKHAIPSIRKQRILVTFTKCQPKKSLPFDSQHLSSPATPHWAPPPNRSQNHIRHQLVPKPYVAVPTTAVLPAPSARPQIAPHNGMQPFFVPAPVATPMPFTAPVPIPPGSTGWTAAPPRHPPPRIPGPGTGVFLPPPGPGNSSQHIPATLTEVDPSVETPTIGGEENVKSDHNNTSASLEDKIDGEAHRQECNGNADGTEDEQAVDKEQENIDMAVASR